MGARSGNNRIMWRTGQKMIEDHVPKIGGGFRPKRKFKVLTLGKLQQMIENGRLKVPEDRPLNVKDIFDARILTLRQKYSGIRLMGRGSENFKLPVRLEVQDATHKAIKSVEDAGGSVETVYYSRLTMRGILKPEKILGKGQLLPRPALPPPTLMRDIYMSEAKRGYLRDLKPGDVVRPQDHPPHVDLSLKVPNPRYPGWKPAKEMYEANQARQAEELAKARES